MDSTTSDRLKQSFLETAMKLRDSQQAPAFQDSPMFPRVQRVYPSFVDGTSITATTTYPKGIPIKLEKNKLPIYSSDDMDSLIAMLTVWIDDRDVIQKMEKMYKHWKAIQNK